MSIASWSAIKMARTSSTLILFFLSLLLASESISALAHIPQAKATRRQNAHISKAEDAFRRCIVSAGLVSSMLIGSPTFADELGRETEAPTLFTGETVMICTKRGPLGACLKTETRTEDNDNDKAKEYFKDPGDRQKVEAEILAKEAQGNVLIQKLRQQSSENKEKNDLVVLQKTLINDQSASFGPFDRQVVILNTDGKTFTLLENPQAMRLKKQGFIEDRKFVKQPTKEDIDNALLGDLEEEGGVGGFVKGFFGDS